MAPYTCDVCNSRNEIALCRGIQIIKYEYLIKIILML